MITPEQKQKLIENNKKISALMKDNETIIREAGNNPPETNFALQEDEKINIPSAYIRPKEYLIKTHHLEEIAETWEKRSNIAYALQWSDFYNFLINRFHFYGSLKTMIFKSAIINVVSIIESIILECANNICNRPDSCRQNNCQYKFNKEQRANVMKALLRMNELEITDFTKEELERISYIVGCRNKVHIRLSKEKEIFSESFDLPIYNEAIIFLKKLCEQINKNGTRIYHTCDFVIE